MPARNSLNKEVDSRKISSRFTNFTLEYKDIYDFALIKRLQIPNLTTNELPKFATEIPRMKDIVIHFLISKLRKINKNYPWSIPDWLKMILMITSTIIGKVFIVIMIYLRKPGNCMLSGKHLNKGRKSKSISQHSHDKGIAMKELNCSLSSAVSRPLASTSTTNCLNSVAQNRITPVSKYLPESPRFSPYFNTNKP